MAEAWPCGVTFGQQVDTACGRGVAFLTCLCHQVNGILNWRQGADTEMSIVIVNLQMLSPCGSGKMAFNI